MHLALVQPLYLARSSPDIAKISIVVPTRRCRIRRNLLARSGRYAFCTNSRFTFISSPSPWLPFHKLVALVQPLYLARNSPAIERKFSLSSLYGDAGYGEVCWPIPVDALLHQIKVYIFRLPIPIPSFLYAPCFDVTIVPC